MRAEAPFLAADFFLAGDFFLAADFFEVPFFAGTFPPAFRASDSPIAMACFRLFTAFPLRPLFSSPRFSSCNAFPTLSFDFCPYFAIIKWVDSRSLSQFLCRSNSGTRFESTFAGCAGNPPTISLALTRSLPSDPASTASILKPPGTGRSPEIRIRSSRPACGDLEWKCAKKGSGKEENENGRRRRKEHKSDIKPRPIRAGGHSGGRYPSAILS